MSVAQEQVTTAVECDEAVTVCAIEVGGGRLDRVVRELYRLGCTLIDQRIPGYLVVPLTPVRRSQVVGLRGVVKVFPVAGTEFARPVTVPSCPSVNQVGEMVRVVSGRYCGVSGVIQSRSESENTVCLDIIMFGRLIPLTLPVDSVEPIPLPEAWRG